MAQQNQNERDTNLGNKSSEQDFGKMDQKNPGNIANERSQGTEQTREQRESQQRDMPSSGAGRQG